MKNLKSMEKEENGKCLQMSVKVVFSRNKVVDYCQPHGKMYCIPEEGIGDVISPASLSLYVKMSYFYRC
jgi:hypothetical protein